MGNRSFTTLHTFKDGSVVIRVLMKLLLQEQLSCSTFGLQKAYNRLIA